MMVMDTTNKDYPVRVVDGNGRILARYRSWARALAETDAAEFRRYRDVTLPVSVVGP